MFFRIDDLALQKDYAGFKRCYVTRVQTRSISPLGTAYPIDDHGEADVIVVCGALKKPNAEWLEVHGGSLKELLGVLSYGFMSYQDPLRPGSYLDRLPEGPEQFAHCAGFESWRRERVEEQVKTKGFGTLLMPRRFIFNQAKGTCSFDLEYRLDRDLPGGLFSIDIDKKANVRFVSPREPGPGVLEDVKAKAAPQISASIQTNLWWAKPDQFAGMPVPQASELPAIAAAGIRGLVALGTELDQSACAAAGLELLSLPMPDEWEPEADQVQALAAFRKQVGGTVAVCSTNPIATGNMLGVALIADGMPIEEALETLESASPQSLESMGQIEFLYIAADQLGIDID